MSGMDFSFRRSARGISVFWMILAIGALVALLIAIAIRLDGAAERVLPDASQEGTVIGTGDTPGTEFEQDRPAAPQQADFEAPDPEVMPDPLTSPVPADQVVRPRDITSVDPMGGFGEEPAGPLEPFFPTPSGPAGADGDPFTMD